MDKAHDLFKHSVFLFGYMNPAIRTVGQALVVVALALCSSCSRRTPVEQSVLVGEWQRVDKPAITMTFLKDGTFSAHVGGERLLGGKYRLLDGEHIILDLDASSRNSGSITNGASMSGEELRITPTGSDVERYKRVPRQPL
jgi:hypothetical protein